MEKAKPAAKSNVTVNPLRLSQPAGAALALMGIRGCVPLWHGVQGCTAFAKILFIQHFREPMPFQTTALTQTSVVMGGEANAYEAVANIDKDAEFVGILTTGVAETSGADLNMIAKKIREKAPQVKLTMVGTPDYEGSLETGWVKACGAVIREFVKPRTKPRPKQVAVLTGPYTTPGEVECLRETFADFYLQPVIFPDLGGSLYGRLADADFSPCTTGGTPIGEIETLADSAFVVSVGGSMRKLAEDLAIAGNIPTYHFDHLCALDEIDRFLVTLSKASGQPVPMKFQIRRQHLLDTLLDTQFYFYNRRAAIAGDPDFIRRWAAPLEGVGLAVTALSAIPFGDIPHGDLRHFAGMIGDAHLLVGSSHVAELAADRGLAAVRAGIPVYDRFGETQSVRIGYAGLARLYMECANALMATPPREAAPYISPLQETLRCV